VRAVNTMLDAILLPIGEAIAFWRQISNGKIDELIAQTYKGDHRNEAAVNNMPSWSRALKKNWPAVTDAPMPGSLSERGSRISSAGPTLNRAAA